MIPILTLLIGMYAVLALGAHMLPDKRKRLVVVSVVAAVQAILMLVDLFTMKIPKF